MTSIPAVIFDLDGTLALIDHRRHHVRGKPKHWNLFYAAMGEDAPNIPIINCLAGLMMQGYHGIICTGRPEEYRQVTMDWLQRHFVGMDDLLMRPTGDYRSDVEIKREMLGRLRSQGYLPTLACDDRDRLVAMWREEGLVCLQAGPGDF